jgi:hypothetical protein
MPRYFDLRSTVLIVVGHGLLPEEEDRPLAYDLKREITARADGAEGRTAVVVTDVWLMGQEVISPSSPAAIRRSSSRWHPRASGRRCGGCTRRARGRPWSGSSAIDCWSASWS